MEVVATEPGANTNDEKPQPTTLVTLVLPGKLFPAELGAKLGNLNEYAVSSRIIDPAENAYY